MLFEAEGDLAEAFQYYENVRAGLGHEMLDEFRRAVNQILRHPGAWQTIDERHRQCRLHRFPYGIIYRVDDAANKVLVVAVSHLSRAPGWWRGRDRG
jgi:toxin ParE2